MGYSLAFKESQIKKILPPSNKSIKEVSLESGVTGQTLRTWITKAKEGTLDKGDTVSSISRSAREKLNLVIESKTISEDDKGHWLRQKGLYSEHITLYEQELRDIVGNKIDSDKKTLKSLQQENKQLEKKLKRSQAALAEMAALYTLKKKAELLWGAKEDD